MKTATMVLGGLSLFLCLLGNARAQCTFSETFDGGFDQLWTVTDPTYVQVSGDALTVVFESPSNDTFHGAVLDPCSYTDLRAGVRMRDLAETRGKAIAFRTQGEFMGYNVNLRSAPFNDVVLSKGSFSPASVLVTAPHAHSSDQWVYVEVEAIGSDIRVWVDSALVITYHDANPAPSGWMFLGINAGGTLSANAEFDDFWISEVEPAVPTEGVNWSTVKSRF